MIGRVHRQPNEQTVHVYYPRIRGTSDEVMSSIAAQKDSFLQEFMGELLPLSVGLADIIDLSYSVRSYRKQ